MSDSVTYSVNGSVSPQELQALLDQTDWANGRSADGIAAMLGATAIQVSARSDGRLVGFGRAISDGVYRALIEDVVVDQAWRAQGVGRRLVRMLIEQLSQVEQVQLDCGEEMRPFYASFGFASDPLPRMKLRKEPPG